jgi:hypothetical protein
MDKAAITALADKYDTDILGYFGDIQRPEDDWLYTSLGKRRKRKNVLLVLTTRGGDPHVAYRISRALQDLYNTRPAASPTPGKKKVAAQGKFTVMVLSKCKSAGTIIALGASNVWMSKSAELGPIDVQLRKPDEVGERTSGLTPMQAMSVLENQSLSMFKRHFQQLRFDSELVFSTKMAAEIATTATVGLLSPIFSQIDPMRLAEVDRSMRISADYGERLNVNLKDNALQRLLAKYPAHGFVIDWREAEEIFKEIEDPPEDFREFIELFDAFGDVYLEKDETYFYWLCNELPAPEAANDAADGAAPENPSVEPVTEPNVDTPLAQGDAQ